MADAPELKPCPFCGSDHIAQECGLDGQPYTSCVDCGANVEGKAGTWNTRADLSAAREAEAVAAGVRAGLLAAAEACADRSTYLADCIKWDGTKAYITSLKGGVIELANVDQKIRALAADPAQVAAIAASVKGGANG